MTFYITTESKEMLNSNFLNMRFFSLIYVPDIICSLNDTYENLSECNRFILNSTIIDTIDTVIKRKKYISMIYANPWIDYDSIKNIHEYLKDNPHIERIVFLDDKYDPKNMELWQYFEEVTFFPSVRKKKIIECESIKTPMFYWVNNLEMPDDMKRKYPECVRTFSAGENE